MREIPHSALACRQNRDFLARVVRVLADRGIRQFLDIGSGLPTRDNVHQIAQRADPDSRVVYVDYDHCKSGCAHASDHRAVITLY
jgi:S-adenosyl methyltransferase